MTLVAHLLRQFRDVHRVIFLDADLVFKNDIYELYMNFDRFSTDQLFGLSHELQPTYFHVFTRYRNSAGKESRIGSLDSGKFPGFNSGDVLIDLDKMRKSTIYAKVLNPTFVAGLAAKYQFQGHLGDQDFFTLLYLEHADLFYVLDCSWNRQTCRYFEKLYPDVFSLYHVCNSSVSVMHFNCNSE